MTTTKVNPLTSHGITGSILAIVRTFIWLLAKPRRRAPGKRRSPNGEDESNLMAVLSKAVCNVRLSQKAGAWDPKVELLGLRPERDQSSGVRIYGPGI